MMSRSEDAPMGPLMTGVIALALLLVHFTLGHVQQGALAATIAASDAQIALEAQKLRQSVLFAHANQPASTATCAPMKWPKPPPWGRAGASAPCARISKSCARPPRMSKPALA
jgi:hypothetical protein